MPVPTSDEAGGNALLDYQVPVLTRPRIWKPVGIIGLILGILSLLTNGVVGLLWLNFGFQSVAPSPRQSVLPAATIAPLMGEYIASRGLRQSYRPGLVSNFPLSANAMEDDLKAMLDRLLAEYGQDMFPNPAKAGVSIVPSTDKVSPALTEPAPLLKFNVPGGRVELGLAKARFEGGGRTAAVYQTTVVPELHRPNGLAEGRNAWFGWPRRFNAITIDQALRPLRSGGVNSNQLGVVAQLMGEYPVGQRNPTSQLVPTIDSPALGQGNELTLGLNGKEYVILADGRFTSLAMGETVNPTSGVVTAAPPQFQPALPGSPALMIAMGGHSFVTAALAIFLIVAGSRAASEEQPVQVNGLRSLARWAVLKYLLIGTEIMLVVAYLIGVDHPQHTTHPFDPANAIFGLIVTVLAQSIFPAIVLAIVFSDLTNRYLTSQGVMLQCIPWVDHWQRVADAVAQSTWLPWVRVGGLVLALVAVLHAIAAGLVLRDEGWVAAAWHAVVTALVGLIAYRMLRLRARGASVVALLVAVLACGPVIAQTRPTQPQTSRPTSAVAERARMMLGGIDLADLTAAENIVADAARLGGDAVAPLTRFLAQESHASLAPAAIDVWRLAKCDQNPAFRQSLAAEAVLFRGPRPVVLAGVEIMKLVSTEPKLLPYWVPLCFDPDEKVAALSRDSVAAIYPEAGQNIADVIRMARGRRQPRELQQRLKDLLSLGTIGQAVIRELYNHPDPRIRLEAARLPLDPADRDNVDAAMDLVLYPTEGIDAARSDDGADLQLRVRGLYRLMASHTSYDDMAKLLVSDQLKTTEERMKLLRAFVALDSSLIAVERNVQPNQLWEPVRKVVRATLESTRTDVRPLITVLDDRDSTVAFLTLTVLKERSARMSIHAEDLLKKLDLSDERLRHAACDLILDESNAVYSPQAISIIRGYLSRGGTFASSRFVDRIRRLPHERRAPLLAVVTEPAMPSELLKQTFDAIWPVHVHAKDTGLDWGTIIRSYLLRESPRPVPANATAAREIIQAMGVRTSEGFRSAGDAFLHVLRHGPAVAQQRLSGVVLADSVRDQFGPASQDLALKLANQPSAAAVKVVKTPPAVVSDRSSNWLSSLAWRTLLGAAFLLCPVGLLISILAMRASRVEHEAVNRTAALAQNPPSSG